MAQLVFSLDRQAEDVLLPGALQAGHAVVARVQTAGELGAVLATHDVDLAIVSSARSRLTPEVRAAAASTGARLVVIALTDAERAFARQVGASEIIPGPASWVALEAGLSSRVVPQEDAGTGHPPAASVTAVWGPTGAPGRTSLAIAIAAELAALGRTVALIDADTYGGAIAPSLGLLDEAPGFAAACRLAGNDALTRSEFDRIAQYVPTAKGALAVLTGIARPGRWPELGHDRVAGTIDAVGAWFDELVVDVGFNLEADEEIASDLFAPRRNAATLAVLERATRVVSVGLADPVGLSRLLRSRLDVLPAAPRAAHSLVINRVRASVVGASPDEQITAAVQRFGGVAPAALVPDDPAAFDLAMRTAKPLADAAPRSAAREAVRRLVVDALLGLPAPGPHRRGRAVRRHGRPEPAPVATSRAPTTNIDLYGVDTQ